MTFASTSSTYRLLAMLVVALFVALSASSAAAQVLPLTRSMSPTETRQQAHPLDKVAGALERGDVAEILRHAAPRVEVATDGSSMLYSRSQADYVLRAFLQEHPPARVVMKAPHEAGSSLFVMGAYVVRGQPRDSLDVYVRYERSGDGWQLREVRLGPAGPE